MPSSITQGSLSLFPAISSAVYALVVQGNTAVLVEPCSALGLSYCNICSFSPLRAFWGYATCSSQVCLGEVTISCECRADDGKAPALGRLCLKHWFAQSCWEVAAALVTTNLAKLFVSPSYLFIQPLSLSDWYQSSPVHVFLFPPFCSKKCQALATRDSLVLPCCMWIRVFVIDVFQHFFGIIFYCSFVNNANRHYMSEIILQFKLHKFMVSKQRGKSEGTVAISPGLVTRKLVCIGMYGTIVLLKQG